MNKDFLYNNDTDNKIFIKGYTYDKKTNNGSTCEMYTGDLEFDKELFLKFLAWYLSDGNTSYNENENKYVINIVQTECEENIKNNTINDIMDLIKQMGFTPHFNSNQIRFNSLTLGKYLKDLGVSHKKTIPLDIYKDFNKHYAQIFLKEYFRGDGHIDKNGCGKFYTSSKILADQLQQLCFIAGWTAMIYTRMKDLVGKKINICGNEVNVNHIGYVVNVTFTDRNREPHINFKKHRTTRPYKGKVYCVNVTNHIIFVRKNGKAVWCGNCIDQLIRSEEGCYKNVQSFRYVNKDNFKIYAPPEVLNDEELFNTFYNLEMFANRFYSEAIDRLNELGYSGEKANQIARHLLPIGTESAVMIGFDIEGLIHLANIRLCTRAELPIRRITQMMIDEVKKVTHEYDDLLVCKCDRDLFCVEDKCCGRKPTKEELKNKLNNQ